MSQITTAADVARLREMTGVGMMDCKKALAEAKGDLSAAVDILRKKGRATAAVKSVREAKEGSITQYIAHGGKLGVLVEVNSESDFVARNELFRAFCEEAAKRLAADANASLETEREALVEVGAGRAETAAKEEFKQLVKDITLQIAAGHPHVVSREQVPADVVAKEREIAAQSDRLKGKPAQAMEKILQGILEKFYQTYCLVDQGFVKRNSEISVKEHVAQIAKQLGDEITIRRFVRFQVGESA